MLKTLFLIFNDVYRMVLLVIYNDSHPHADRKYFSTYLFHNGIKRKLLICVLVPVTANKKIIYRNLSNRLRAIVPKNIFRRTIPS
ncbi:MAG: hypothetical protein ACJA2D_002811 [Pseudohongiellaceae bacterium]|jgi:hypothetical protein